MGKLKAKATGKKAEVEARKAAGEAKAAIADVGRASRDLAAALTESVRSNQLDERALELADRLRETEAYARGAQLAETTSKRLRDARLDERAADLTSAVRDSDVAARVKASEVAARAQKSSDEALGRAGAWLAAGPRGKKLGVRTRRSGAVPWLLAALGVLVGYAVATLTTPKRGQDLRDEMGLSAQRLVQDTPGAPPGAGQTPVMAEQTPPAAQQTPPAAQQTPVTAQQTPVTAQQGQKPAADEIRARLGADPRTASLPRLNVNVAEGTAFIRGTVPPGYDEGAIREIAGAVEGVRDIDLQVTVTA